MHLPTPPPNKKKQNVHHPFVFLLAKRHHVDAFLHVVIVSVVGLLQSWFRFGHVSFLIHPMSVLVVVPCVCVCAGAGARCCCLPLGFFFLGHSASTRTSTFRCDMSIDVGRPPMCLWVSLVVLGLFACGSPLRGLWAPWSKCFFFLPPPPPMHPTGKHTRAMSLSNMTFATLCRWRNGT